MQEESVQGGAAPAFVIRRWADFGIGPPVDLAVARDAIAQLLPLPQGGLAFAAADPGWGRVAPDRTLAQAQQPATADFRASGVTLAIAPDGLAFRFTLRAEAPPLVFDAAAGRLGAAEPGRAFLPARIATPGLAPTDWHNGNRPRLGQVPLRLEPGEFARSLAILPAEDGLLLGTDTHLRRFDTVGRLLDSLPLPGAAWGLAVAPSGVVAAALGDGTLRWFAPNAQGRLEERGALFVHADGRRWVLFTPEGLFDHAAEGGQDLVGVHLNNGRAQTPEWASFRQAYRALFAPAETRARIAGDPAPARSRMVGLGAVRDRIGRLQVLTAGQACVVLEDTSCRQLDWSPAATLPEGAVALRLGFVAQDRGLGLGPLDVLVNDRIAVRGQPAVGEAMLEVPLDPGPNRIATRLYSDDRSLFAEGPAMELPRAGDKALPQGAGRLVVLAIGIDRYANRTLDLRFAVADARSVAETLRAAGATLFREVAVTLLTDAAATRAGILEALATAAVRVRQEDTFVLYRYCPGG